MALLNTLARILSIVAASAVTVAVILFPRLIALDMHSVPHGWLVCLFLGMSAAFVHGFGFIPKNRALRVIFSPMIAWPLLSLGAWQVFF